MKNLFIVISALVLVIFAVGPVGATVWFSDGFETAWSGDYASGWENTAYRHGPAPVGKMMQQTTTAKNGSYGLKLIADSVPESWMWWAGVSPTSLPALALTKQYDPYVSAWYYDDMVTGKAGQVFAVPSWVNPYIPPGEDWTDVQFGGRYNNRDNYYYVAAGQNSTGWTNTGVVRSNEWHKLMFQLSSTDGKIHFSIDGIEVGTSYRNDYADLGTEIGLFTMFDPAIAGSKPSTIWDDFEVGSNAPIPEPGTLLLLGSGLLGLAGYAKVRSNRKKK
jgi:hypothetical protein